MQAASRVRSRRCERCKILGTDIRATKVSRLAVQRDQLSGKCSLVRVRSTSNKRVPSHTTDFQLSFTRIRSTILFLSNLVFWLANLASCHDLTSARFGGVDGVTKASSIGSRR